MEDENFRAAVLKRIEEKKKEEERKKAEAEKQAATDASAPQQTKQQQDEESFKKAVSKRVEERMKEEVLKRSASMKADEEKREVERKQEEERKREEARVNEEKKKEEDRKRAEEAKLADEERQREEAKRVAAEQEAKRVEAEQEAKRVEAEQEAKRLADEQEAKRLADEQEAKRVAAEQEAKRLADEQEAKRVEAQKQEDERIAKERKAADDRRAKEEQDRKAEEDRRAKEAEEARAERERQRLEEERREAERKKKQDEDEAEQRRLAEEQRVEEEKRKKLEEEQRKKKEAEAVKPVAPTGPATCEKCGFQNEPGKAFCKKCGMRSAAQIAETDRKNKEAEDKSKAAEKGLDYEKLREEERKREEEEKRKADAQNEKEKLDVKAFGSSGGSFTCEKCGFVNEAGKTFCKKCGMKSAAMIAEKDRQNKEAEDKQKEVERRELEAKKKEEEERLSLVKKKMADMASLSGSAEFAICEKCGFDKNELSKLFCKKCGQRMEAKSLSASQADLDDADEMDQILAETEAEGEGARKVGKLNMNNAFLANLDKKLKDGPVVKEEPLEAKPLEHLTKARPAGPKKRNPGTNTLQPTSVTIDAKPNTLSSSTGASSSPQQRRLSASTGSPSGGRSPSPSRDASPNPGARTFGVPKGAMGGIGSLAAQLKKTGALPKEGGGDGSEDSNEPKGPVFDPTAVLKGKAGSSGRPEVTKKLISVYSPKGAGHKNIIAKRVELHHSSLSQENVYVLDTLEEMFLYQGKKASKMAMTVAVDIAARMNRMDHGSRLKPPVTVKLGDEDHPTFWEAVGGKPSGGVPDTIDEPEYSDSLFVYVQEAGEYQLIEGRREQAQLNESKSFILDCKDEFYIWHGRKVAKDAKEEANFLAQERWNANTNRAPWAEQTRAAQGGEPVLFVYKFASWSSEATLSGSTPTKGNIAVSEFKEITMPDVMKMHGSEPPLGGKKIDDGQDGSVYVWVVDGTGKLVVPKEEQGQFYRKKSYVVAYNWGNKERWLIYQWQGTGCSISDKGTGAGQVIDVNAKMCMNTATQEVVPQFLEPKHFLLIWQKKFVVHEGSDKIDLTKESRLYSIRGSQANNTRAFEVGLSAENLFSGDVFLLATPSEFFIWEGKHCTPYAKTHATSIAANLNGKGVPVTAFAEGKEPGAFWSGLGGKKDYFSTNPHAERIKVFTCVNQLGEFKATRLFDYGFAHDLHSNRMAIIDLYEQVWLWIGKETKVKDIELGCDVALAYNDKANDGRPKTRAKWVKEGNEPHEFLFAFQAFAKRDKVDNSQFGFVEDLKKTYNCTFTLEELKNRKALPNTVNQGILETYLSDNDFETVFGYSREEFNKSPKWKQTNEKKRVGLY